MLVKARVGFEEPVELADHSAEARVVCDYLEAGWQHPRKVADPSGERSGRVRSTRLSGKVAGYLHLGARRHDRRIARTDAVESDRHSSASRTGPITAALTVLRELARRWVAQRLAADPW
jgi:hypothetical protein